MRPIALATTALAALCLATSAGAQMSEHDRSDPAASNQDQSLSPHRTPPTETAREEIPVDRLKLPEGFKAEIWSHGHPAGRTMVMGDNGTVFMGSRQIGRVYAITDEGGERQVRTVLSGLTQPNGLVFHDGALYVFAINEVHRYPDIENNLDDPGEPEVLTDAYNLPPEVHHNWKYADVGPDGKMYVQVGAPCNICELNNAVHGQIRRYNPDGTEMEIFVRGSRNSVGFDWHPETGELWWTDNGRDWAGNDGPEDELNRTTEEQAGGFYGFPYCHADGVVDPDITIPRACEGVMMPAALLGPHAGSLGLKFYTGDMFPDEYRNRAFIARRGSWNREDKFGYDVVTATTNADGTATIEPFMTGLLDEEANEFVGRPTYLLQLDDGSLLVADEYNGATYRISYDGS